MVKSYSSRFSLKCILPLWRPMDSFYRLPYFIQSNFHSVEWFSVSLAREGIFR
jgi:hypothetical protein